MTANGTAALDSKKQGADLGFMIRDWEATKKFYVDTLGFEHSGDMPFPMGATGGTMHRVQAGTITLKFTQLKTLPEKQNPGGGVTGAIGMRYYTFWITNLADVVANAKSAGYKIPVPVTEIRPGVTIAMIEDPDGNWVEFLQAS